MIEHYIHVYATSENPHPPTLEDDEKHVGNTEQEDENLTTEVNNEDTITWSIYPPEGNAITSIDNIIIRSNNFLSSGPTNNHDGTWSANVGDISDPSMYGDGFLSYTIYYTVDNIQHEHQDPKIRLRPTIKK